MPTIFELFGFPLHDRSEIADKTRRSAFCPFMEDRCDGGGNRNQTKIYINDKDLTLRSTHVRINHMSEAHRAYGVA